MVFHLQDLPLALFLYFCLGNGLSLGVICDILIEEYLCTVFFNFCSCIHVFDEQETLTWILASDMSIAQFLCFCQGFAKDFPADSA